MNNQDISTRIWKFIGLAALAVFVGAILWSMWVETLRPLFRQGDTAAIINNLVGLPLILIGVGIFVYGGIVFVRDTFGALGDEAMQKNTAVITAKPSLQEVAQARKQNMLALFRAWKAGLGWLTLGFFLLAVGSYLINR